MKYLLSIIFLIFITSSFAQISGKVIDAITNEPIIYTNIWVQNQNKGTTSDQNGYFKFDKLPDTATLVFSALSYENKTIKVSELDKKVKLKPISIELETVNVSPPKLRQEIKTGKVKKQKVSVWYCSGDKPYRMGKIFNYQKKYEKTPFLKSIEFVTNAEKTDRKILIHVYEVGEGNPENWNILAQNIEYIAKKGDKTNQLDLSTYQIKIPKTGVMVVMESLIIKNNFYEYEAKNSQTGKKITIQRFEPCFGTIPTESTDNTWIYYGKWKRQKHKQSASSPRKYRNKYTELAMELTLSD